MNHVITSITLSFLAGLSVCVTDRLTDRLDHSFSD
jgi:hypothetical protein